MDSIVEWMFFLSSPSMTGADEQIAHEVRNSAYVTIAWPLVLALLDSPSGSYMLDALVLGQPWEAKIELLDEMVACYTLRKSLEDLLEACRNFAWLNVTQADLAHYVSFTRF